MSMLCSGCGPLVTGGRESATPNGGQRSRETADNAKISGKWGVGGIEITKPVLNPPTSF
jgi:hypothetical protein